MIIARIHLVTMVRMLTIGETTPRTGRFAMEISHSHVYALKLCREIEHPRTQANLSGTLNAPDCRKPGKTYHFLIIVTRCVMNCRGVMMATEAHATMPDLKTIILPVQSLWYGEQHHCNNSMTAVRSPCTPASSSAMRAKSSLRASTGIVMVAMCAVAPLPIPTP